MIGLVRIGEDGVKLKGEDAIQPVAAENLVDCPLQRREVNAGSAQPLRPVRAGGGDKVELAVRISREGFTRCFHQRRAAHIANVLIAQQRRARGAIEEDGAE